MRLRLRTWPEVRILPEVGAASSMRRMHVMAFFYHSGTATETLNPKPSSHDRTPPDCTLGFRVYHIGALFSKDTEAQLSEIPKPSIHKLVKLTLNPHL